MPHPIHLLRVAVAVLVTGVLAPATARATVTEYPTCSLPPTADSALCTSGRSPNPITAGPDGAVWFGTATGEVGRITIDGALTLSPIPGVPGPASRFIGGITTGPDGALWLTEDFGNRIHRLATDGTFTSVDVPAARPGGITRGPDGALWFVAAGTNSIGRITTAGAVTMFPLPAPSGSPIRKLSDIVAGADGRLWFNEIQNRKIGAITTAGVATEYALPSGSGIPGSLTSGPDGAVWWTDYSRGLVGRITPVGDITMRALPVPSHPASIARGPGGKLWIGDTGAGAVLEFDPSTGATTPTPLLFAGALNGLVQGPDGSMWFTEATYPRVGRIATAATKVPVLKPFSPAADTVAVPAPVFATPGVPDLTSGVVRLPVTATGAATTLELTLVARPARGTARRLPARSAATARHRVELASAKTSVSRRGTRVVRLKLTAAGRRAVRKAGRAGLKVEVGARTVGRDRRDAVRQRSVRLR